jgi:protein-S-isoprenylcysteine O-methyltransferase Ste14
MLMHLLENYLLPILWIAFLVYWQAMAADVKATQRVESAVSRFTRAVLFGAAIVLLSYPRIPVPWLYRHFLPEGYATFFGGAAITAAGLLFSVWARRHLGRNWSRSVTIKEGHELIVSGPYALVRHPIYTGLLTGFLGTAVATTEVRGALAFALVFISLWTKLRLEEQWMRAQFEQSYESYSRRVAMLVPFIL